MKIIVLHHSNQGNNFFVAKEISKKIKCDIHVIKDVINLENYNIIIFVLSNTGDEELMPQMEEFLEQLLIKNKKYILCELGSYFGIGKYHGCKKIAIQILDNLNWIKLTDMSLDSTPELDKEKLEKWLQEISNALHDDDFRNSKYALSN